MESAQDQERQASAQQLLKKAYLLLSNGHFEEALNYCDRAAEESEDDVLARTLRGAFLTASGRPVEAMQELMRLHQRRRETILSALYLAEACFLAGRHRRGWKVLEGIDDQELAESRWTGLAAQLHETWDGLAELEGLPKPLTVPLNTGGQTQQF